jgi:hypothetical protein
MSPLSAAATIGAGTMGLVQPKYDSAGKLIVGSSLLDQIKKAFEPTTSTTGNQTANQTTGTLTPDGLAVLKNPASPTGFSDSDGNPVNEDGTPI